MDSSTFVSVVTATLNERGNVAQLVERVHKAIGNSPYEIVVVDDNSNDGTVDILEGIENSYSSLRILSNQKREGLLKSNLKGLKESRGKIKIVMDADLQHPPERIREMIKRLESGVDGVVMSRFVHGSLMNTRTAYRKSATSLAIAFCHLLVPQTRRFNDPISGFFAIGEEVTIPYEKLFNALGNQRGYKILIPIIANNSHRNIVEVPYRFESRHSGVSKIGRENLLIPRYVSELSQYRILFRRTAF